MTRKTLTLAVAVAALSACQQSDAVRNSTAGLTPGDTSETKPYDGVAASETVRFTGTEPFWGGQVAGSSLVYKTPDNPDGTTITVERFAGRGGMSWSGTYQGKPFRLAVSEGECSDGMSDRSYPLTATLAVAGEQRSGCAWSDKRTFSDRVEPSPAAFQLAAQNLVMGQWRKAANGGVCAPVSFSQGAADGTPRSAPFSGGWAVAWDRPGLRSAFGVAGTSILPSDAADAKEQRARLARQWPMFRELAALPRPSFAGYGVEGAGDYPAADPNGEGLNSLAYVRVAGQECDYNVWSRLGRAHLETLLDGLRLVAVES